MQRIMHKFICGGLALILAMGSTFPSFAVQNYGPGFVNQETEAVPEPVPDQAQTPIENQDIAIASVPVVAPIQIQLLNAETMSWSDPVTDGSMLQVGAAGAMSLCIYPANSMFGDIIYRTYSTGAGWTNWVLSGAHTAWDAKLPIEAVQIRLKGQIADSYNVFYSAMLSDGSICGWASNGSSTGALSTGSHITGLRVTLVARGGESAYDTTNRVFSPALEGINFAGGLPTYTDGTGVPYTGWVWNDQNRYYFVDGNAVTGWQYIDSYKYYFEGDGRLVTDLEPYLNDPGPYEIRINKQMNCTTIYVKDGDNGFIIPYKSFLCSTGDDTPIGTFKTPAKYRWRLMVTGEYCQYLTRLGPGLPILMHSVIYEKEDPYTLFPSTYNYLGISRSHGCIRYTTADCKWIYDHCPLGTSVTVYNSPIPGPYDRPALKIIIPSEQTWDPTDDSVPENGL